MSMHRQRIVIISGTALVLVAAIFSQVALAAQSSTLYPTEDSISASSTPVIMGSGSTTCTFNPGSFTIPTKGNPSGPLTTNLTVRPTFTACTFYNVETSGTWTLSTQYGSAEVTITIPINGIKITGSGVSTIINAMNTWTLKGIWNNGFSSPVSVPSSIYFYSSKNTYYTGGTPHEFSIGSGFSTLTDTTHPASLPVLGP